MLARITLECSKRLEENGQFTLTFQVPNSKSAKEDTVSFTGPRELTFRTIEADKAKGIKPGDTFELQIS